MSCNVCGSLIARRYFNRKNCGENFFDACSIVICNCRIRVNNNIGKSQALVKYAINGIRNFIIGNEPSFLLWTGDSIPHIPDTMYGENCKIFIGFIIGILL